MTKVEADFSSLFGIKMGAMSYRGVRAFLKNCGWNVENRSPSRRLLGYEL